MKWVWKNMFLSSYCFFCRQFRLYYAKCVVLFSFSSFYIRFGIIFRHLRLVVSRCCSTCLHTVPLWHPQCRPAAIFVRWHTQRTWLFSLCLADYIRTICSYTNMSNTKKKLIIKMAYARTTTNNNSSYMCC